MPSRPVQQDDILSETENRQIFVEDIQPETLDETEKVVLPKAIFLGGQSGSGKSNLAAFNRKQFDTNGGAVIINSDALREYHPAFAILQHDHSNEASFLVDPDTRKWQAQLINIAISDKRNLILDGTLGGDSAPIQQTIKRLQENGYTVQLSILAVPALLSRLGIYKRYEDQLEEYGIGRWVGMATHDRLYTQILHNLDILENAKAVDRIQIYGRSTGQAPPLLYDNWLDQGEWHVSPQAVRALEDGRNRPWSSIEQDAYRNALLAVKGQMNSRGADDAYRSPLENQLEKIPLIYRPARPDDVQRYFDWANDPLTRQQSFNTNPIEWENHTAWFSRKLIDPNTLMLVFETQQSEPVGQVRFERMPDEVVIGVSVDGAFRGQGLAPVMLRAAVEVYHARFPSQTLPIHAYIRPDNRASIRSFEKGGFVFSHESGKFGVPSKVYVFSNISSYY